MNKSLAGLVGVVLLIVPGISLAQTVPTDNTALINALTALVQVLEQEIQSILAQQTAQTTVLTSIAQSIQSNQSTGMGTPAPQTTDTTPVATSTVSVPVIPTPKIVSVTQNSDFSASNLSVGTFELQFLGYRLRYFPLQYSSPILSQNGVPIVVAINSQCTGISRAVCQWVVNAPDNNDPVQFNVVLSALPAPGTYSLSIPSIPTELQDGGLVQSMSSDITFTFTVASSTNQ